MRLATVGGGKDGALVVISADGRKAVPVPQDRCPSLISAVEDWSRARGFLQEIADRLEQGKSEQALDAGSLRFLAPLPRTYAWLDGSAFIQHVILVRKARGAEPPEDLFTVPLMYQGISDILLGPDDDIPLIDPAHGLDFEGEIAVVTDFVPMGTKAEQARDKILLVLLMNDVSLRNLIPRELATGFGFFHGKPSSSFAPFAVTPDELGDSWQDGRLFLDLEVKLNGKLFGHPNAGEMHFSFYELIEHACKTRSLSAGTIIGSGTVSNRDPSVGSTCIAEVRMLEKINSGEMVTPFMKPGDAVEMNVVKDGRSVFGSIRQKVVLSSR